MPLDFLKECRVDYGVVQVQVDPLRHRQLFHGDSKVELIAEGQTVPDQRQIHIRSRPEASLGPRTEQHGPLDASVRGQHASNRGAVSLLQTIRHWLRPCSNLRCRRRSISWYSPLIRASACRASSPL